MFNAYLDILKSVSVLKNTTVQKTIGNLVNDTVTTTKANLSSDFNICDMVKKYDKENKAKKMKNNSILNY